MTTEVWKILAKAAFYALSRLPEGEQLDIIPPVDADLMTSDNLRTAWQMVDEIDPIQSDFSIKMNSFFNEYLLINKDAIDKLLETPK